MSQDFDLVCIGGGIAGLVAGVRAAERGLNVAVLEKGTDPRYPCNARWSGGIIHIAYTDPKDAQADLRAAILRKTDAPIIVPGQSGAEPGLIGAAWLGLEKLGGRHG